MATLNLIADEIAGSFDRPFDAMFKARVKSLFKHTMAVLLRQQINKYGINDIYKTRFNVKIQTTTDLNKGSASNLYRTVDKIPIPLRYHSDDPFTFVGDANKHVPCIYSKPIELQYNGLLNMNVNKPPRYMYLNEYIYLFNINSVDVDNITDFNLAVQGAYQINDIITPQDELNNKTFNDDTTLIFPDDLIFEAKALLLKSDMMIIDDKDKVKPTNIDNV